jgi:hypothetical protein
MKNNMIRAIYKFLVFVIFLGLFSCNSTEYITVAEYKPTISTTTNSFYYALPRSTFKVDVEFIRTTRIPGPYYAYAERFLSIENALRKDSISWKVSDVSISIAKEADPNHYYIVESSTNDISYNNLFEMSEQGLIIDLSAQKQELYNSTYLEDRPDFGVPYKDLSVVENFGTVKDTLYRLVFKDTAFVKTPLIKYQVEQKTMEKKANEAALFIFELREKRFELITGNSENAPEGTAMRAALDEITRLENEYLSLFIGKTQTDKFTFSYDVTPDEKLDLTRETLFRFSEKNGVMQEGMQQGASFTIEIAKESSNSNIAATTQESLQNKVFYRTAEPGIVKVLLGNKILSTSKANVYQFGKIVALPINVTLKEVE